MSAYRLTTYYLDAFLDALDEPPVLREAKALKAKFAQMDIIIRAGEKIVGCMMWEPFDFMYSSGVTYNKWFLDSEEAKTLDTDTIESFKAKISKCKPYITRSYLFDTITENEWRAMPQGAGVFNSLGWGSHMTQDLRRLLRLGLPGLAKEIEYYASKHSNSINGSVDSEFFEGMRITLDAIRIFIRRHAEKADEISASCKRESQENLRRIAEDCLWLCENPPETFTQALQLLWFFYFLSGPDSFGRFDRALEDYYDADLESGRISREEAGEFLKDVWLKIDGIYNMTIGGLTPDGQPSYSDLTALCLEVTETLGRADPNLCLRINSKTPRHIWDLAGRCIGRGTGLPALYNDDVIIPALIELGVAPQDARDYSLAGCSQVVIPGRSNFGCDDGVFNVAKCLDLALHDGKDPLTGQQVGPATGTPEDFSCFDEFLQACRVQIEAAVKLHVSVLNKTDSRKHDRLGDPLRSLLCEDCLSSARTIWQGGARYNAIQTECVGITNTTDSLAALKKLVFEKKIISLKDLVEVLDADWKGREDLRALFIDSAPKFGNDIDEVDEQAIWVSKTVWSEIQKHRCTRGNGHIIPGGVVFHYHPEYGRRTGATPDGRKSKEPLADSCGPAQGRDVKGPTAVVRSVCKMPLPLAPTCVVVNMKFTRELFANTQSRDKILTLFQTYFQMGGMQLQITVANRDELIDAKTNPDKHRGLIVRVGGYSANFISLSEELQDDIIRRTEQGTAS